MKTVRETSGVADKIRQLYKITGELEKEFPGSKFTPDGHMIGSIGEVLVADHYGLELLDNSAKTHDAKTKDGTLVQIKATQMDRVALSSEPNKLIVIKILPTGEWEEVYNGPGKEPWNAAGKMQKNGQRPILLTRLKALMGIVADNEKISPRKREKFDGKSMSMEEKSAAYKDLVGRVKDSYQTEQDGLIWCPDCEEINLWTYWQGRGHFDAKIMLVGQDWGNPEQKEATAVMNHIKKINQGQYSNYMDGNLSLTDKNLVKLFESIGYHIDTTDLHNQDLFFTNFVLGYRQGNISQGARAEWFKKDTPYFKELVSIIKPKTLLCLGKITFQSVLEALEYRQRLNLENYNDFIESEQNPVEITMEDGHRLSVYALAHCGSFGTMNRNHNRPKHEDILAYQMQDWSKIKV